MLYIYNITLYILIYNFFGILFFLRILLMHRNDINEINMRLRLVMIGLIYMLFYE